MAYSSLYGRLNDEDSRLQSHTLENGLSGWKMGMCFPYPPSTKKLDDSCRPLLQNRISAEQVAEKFSSGPAISTSLTFSLG